MRALKCFFLLASVALILYVYALFYEPSLLTPWLERRSAAISEDEIAERYRAMVLHFSVDEIEHSRMPDFALQFLQCVLKENGTGSASLDASILPKYRLIYHDGFPFLSWTQEGYCNLRYNKTVVIGYANRTPENTSVELDKPNTPNMTEQEITVLAKNLIPNLVSWEDDVIGVEFEEMPFQNYGRPGNGKYFENEWMPRWRYVIDNVPLFREYGFLSFNERVGVTLVINQRYTRKPHPYISVPKKLVFRAKNIPSLFSAMDVRGATFAEVYAELLPQDAEEYASQEITEVSAPELYYINPVTYIPLNTNRIRCPWDEAHPAWLVKVTKDYRNNPYHKRTMYLVFTVDTLKFCGYTTDSSVSLMRYTRRFPTGEQLIQMRQGIQHPSN